VVESSIVERADLSREDRYREVHTVDFKRRIYAVLKRKAISWDLERIGEGLKRGGMVFAQEAFLEKRRKNCKNKR